MAEKFTLTEVAYKIATQLGGDNEAQALLVRQIRNLASRGVIQISETKSGKNTKYLDRRDAAIARIKVAMVHLWLDASPISEAGKFMEMAVDARLEMPPIEGHFPPRGIDAVLLDLDNPDAPEWHFIFRIRYLFGTGTRVQVGGFVRADQIEQNEASPLSLQGTNADGTSHADGVLQTEGEFKIPATAILRNFFAS